jgi:hypothetical protein
MTMTNDTTRTFLVLPSCWGWYNPRVLPFFQPMLGGLCS